VICRRQLSEHVTPTPKASLASHTNRAPCWPVSHRDVITYPNMQECYTNISSYIRSLAEILPRDYVEPLEVALVSPVASSLGRLCASGAIASKNIVIRAPRFAFSGKQLRIDLTVNPLCSAGELENSDVMIAALARSTTPSTVFIQSSGEAESVLPYTFYQRAGHKSLSVVVEVPVVKAIGSFIVLRSLYVAGLSAAHETQLPLSIPIVRGLQPPLKFADCGMGMQTPAVSDEGVLYVVRKHDDGVKEFLADGSRREGDLLSCLALGLSDQTVAAAVCNESCTLLLADDNSRNTIVVAVDLTTRRPRWTSRKGEFSDCVGLAIMPMQRCVAASSYSKKEVRVLRVADGALVTSVSPLEGPCWLAYDAASETLFINTRKSVVAATWDDTAGTFGPVRPVVLAGETNNNRPLVVIPAAPGAPHESSSLIVATASTRDALCISLPNLDQVRPFRFPSGIEVMGLAADPSGNAIVVISSTDKTMHVLPWPLPEDGTSSDDT
jgi:hypothetical protein